MLSADPKSSFRSLRRSRSLRSRHKPRALAAAGEPPHAKGPPPGAHAAPGPRPPGAVGPRVGGPAGPGPRVGGPAGPGPRVGGGPPGARVVHGGPIPSRNFAGHAYRGHLAWEGGRWHHQVYNGRMGWWWDVGGVWYFYPQRFDGPPGYVSEDYVDDVAYGDDPGPAPVAGAYAPPPGAYPPPPPDPGAAGVGGAIVGGVLGGLIDGPRQRRCRGRRDRRSHRRHCRCARGLLALERRLLLPLSVRGVRGGRSALVLLISS